MSSSDSGQTAKKSELLRRYRALESEFAHVQAELTALGVGESMPGVFLTMEIAGVTVALPAVRVREVVRLVETTPLPGAPRHVLGTFLYRGDPVIALHLGAYLGRSDEPRIDNHLVVLRSARPLAFVVDRVVALLEAPVVAEEQAADEPALRPWRASKLISGVCRAGEALVPLLNLEPLLDGVPQQ